MKILPVSLALAVALAGCTAEPPTDEPVEPAALWPGAPPPGNESAAPPPPSGPVVSVFNGTVGGAGVPGGPKVGLQFLGTNNAPFDLPNGSSGFVAELAWEGSDTLELVLRIPDEYCGNATDPAGVTATCDAPPSAEGASPLKVVVTDPTFLGYVGSWNAGAFVVGASPGTAFTMYLSLFEGVPPTDNYTAVPA